MAKEPMTLQVHKDTRPLNQELDARAPVNNNIAILKIVSFLGSSSKKNNEAGHALQKQVSCFNHRVVTLVADKLER